MFHNCRSAAIYGQTGLQLDKALHVVLRGEEERDVARGLEARAAHDARDEPEARGGADDGTASRDDGRERAAEEPLYRTVPVPVPVPVPVRRGLPTERKARRPGLLAASTGCVALKVRRRRHWRAADAVVASSAYGRPLGSVTWHDVA